MITAHLPSGYIFARTVQSPHAVYPFALLGAVLPDFDMFWFHLVDMKAFHHHKYWVHAPGFWLPIAVIVLLLLSRFIRHRTRFPVMQAATIFFAAVFLHLILDSLAGSIMWLWPLSDTLYVVTEVLARYSNWVVSFLLHWTFTAELLIWGIAIYLFLKRNESTSNAN